MAEFVILEEFSLTYLPVNEIPIPDIPQLISLPMVGRGATVIEPG